MLSFFRKLGLVFIFSALATAFTPLHCLANSAACALSLPAIAKQTMKIYFTGNAAAVDKFAQQVTTHPQYRQACVSANEGLSLCANCCHWLAAIESASNRDQKA